MTGSASPAAAEANIELKMWLRLLACANLVTTELRRRLRQEFGLSLPSFDILAQIARPPLDPTMGELSQRLMVSKGSVTDLIERLEAKGLVCRSADARDGRVQHVHLTPKGQRAVDLALPAHNDWIKSLAAGLPPDTVRQLCALLGEFKQALRAPPSPPAVAANSRITSGAPEWRGMP